MAKIPPIKRLSIEDFKAQADWIGPLLSAINLFNESVSDALNRKLTFAENIAAEVKDIEISVPSSGSPYPISYSAKIRPTSLWVGNAVEKTANPSPITSPIYVDWEYINGSVRINNVTGLTAGMKYRITLVSIAG